MRAIVEFDRVGFAYAAGRRPDRPFEIRGLSFDVAPGEILGLIGPNASGKTTVVRLMAGLLAPAAGAIVLEGAPLRGLSRTQVATRVAVVPQDAAPGLGYTVEDLVLMGRFPHAPGRFFESRQDRAIAVAAMQAAAVATLASEPLARLSGGERQRVMLARALAQEPRVCVLDEPTAHLDLRHQAECVGLLRRLRRESGLTVVLVTHDLNLAAEVCDRLLLLDGGAAVRVGAPAGVLAADVLAAVYRCPVEVTRHPASGRPRVAVVWPGDDGPGPEGGDRRIG